MREQIAHAPAHGIAFPRIVTSRPHRARRKSAQARSPSSVFELQFIARMQLLRALGMVAACATCAGCVTGEPVDEVTASTLNVVQTDSMLTEITARPYPSTVGSFDVATY